MISMIQEVSIRQVLECSVCNQELQSKKSLKPAIDKNDRVTILLVLIENGCCPLCGQLVVPEGQTPEPYLAKYNVYLERQLRERT